MAEPKTTEYVVPQSVGEAVEALSESPKARVIAGGTDLMVGMREGHVHPTRLVDITRIQELIGISTQNGSLRIGAATKIDEILHHPTVRSEYPALVDAGQLLGGWQIQNMATLAGNLCNASPAAEMSGPLLVLDAEVEVMGPSGERRIPLGEFWTGPGKTVLEPAEILTTIVIPGKVSGRLSAYQRVDIRHSVDIALVSSAVGVELSEGKVQLARIALGAVAPTVIRVTEAEAYLQGRTLSEEVLDKVEDLAEAAAVPITDVRASAEYRSAMAGVLARRVLLLAAERG
ncbi:MAG: xanthine dehydrogenase family protein subunit M [Deltaproteobacteria bacterium]|nr:xanthine dehydrogenase family protein subunit M [Deltaproteobacteria bacterium]MCZ6450169.1 xanthine dehydrogenase family protein subunit M [Deltaproteobacteria bacterium]MCZ6549024.1 xanthine dehydrogenase family protein subunit M [Deltaproteobacteria bacterium]MCZ6564247.1 xanthine dehydrogenase family protein subunit M [Deltaproteobacteria bacterium]